MLGSGLAGGMVCNHMTWITGLILLACVGLFVLLVLT